VVDDGRISALGHASELLPTLDADIEVSTTRMR
jgi:guanine deaminase